MKGDVAIWHRGEITVFASLLMAVVLVFFQACLKSTQYAFLRSQTEEALELAELSVLSEFHRELLERYDLFYLDLGYGTSVQDETYLKTRIRGFLDENLPLGETKTVEVWEFSRATDGNGMAFYEQAVSVMKQKTGAALLETMLEYRAWGTNAEAKEQTYQNKAVQEQQNLEELKRRREEEEQVTTPNPISHTETLKSSSVLNLVLQDPSGLSGKKADLQKAPSVRSCLKGAGARGIYSGSIANDAFFYAYLQGYFTDAVECLTKEKTTGNWLDYQLEYVIAGKDSDLANLESVCSRLLAIREGLNYAYLLTDAAKVAECEALAAAVVGATMIPGLVEAVKQVLLLTWAFAESVVDVRTLLAGKKVVFRKDSSSWRLSLAGALNLQEVVEKTEDTGTQGLSYQDYLSMLLMLSARETSVERSLDVLEGVIRGTDGNESFYLDQCVDGFWMRAVIENGQEWSAERWVGYEW